MIVQGVRFPVFFGGPCSLIESVCERKMSGKNPDGAAPRLEWPMLLQYAGEAELEVVRDQDEWALDPDHHARPYQPEDRLIDSAGVEYRLEFTRSSGRGQNAILPTGRRYSSKEVESIAERHVVSAGAKPEWLAGHLRDIVDSQRIRATILYLAKLSAEDVSEASEDDLE